MFVHCGPATTEKMQELAKEIQLHDSTGNILPLRVELKRSAPAYRLNVYLNEKDIGQAEIILGRILTPEEDIGTPEAIQRQSVEINFIDWSHRNTQGSEILGRYLFEMATKASFYLGYEGRVKVRDSAAYYLVALNLINQGMRCGKYTKFLQVLGREKAEYFTSMAFDDLFAEWQARNMALIAVLKDEAAALKLAESSDLARNYVLAQSYFYFLAERYHASEVSAEFHRFMNDFFNEFDEKAILVAPQKLQELRSSIGVDLVGFKDQWAAVVDEIYEHGTFKKRTRQASAQAPVGASKTGLLFSVEAAAASGGFDDASPAATDETLTL